MQVFPPINLYDEKLRKLTTELGPVWVRVSGAWATRCYYDFDGTTGGIIPEGYNSILIKEQWIGVLDFVKAVNGKLLISMSNCEGLHKVSEPWNPSEAEKIFALSKEYGVPIDAAEFVNEPNMMEISGLPKGYSAADYAKDQDIFFRWVRENYPETRLVGPCVTGGGGPEVGNDRPGSGGIGDLMPNIVTTDDLMEGTTEPLDIYSYHYYNGVSERFESFMPFMHWDSEKTLSEEYLAVAGDTARFHGKLRDKYCPNGEMWVTESGDAGGGGNT